jgi:uncharacterized cupin superfamily protein
MTRLLDQTAPVCTVNIADDLAAQKWEELKLDVVAGDPRCRVMRLRLHGARTTTHRSVLFEVEPSTFKWQFEYDESLFIAAGEATVTFRSGEVITLKAGTICSVLAGESSTWQVHKPLRKFVVLTSS